MALKDHGTLGAKPAAKGFDAGTLIADLSEDDLLKLRHAVDKKLQIDPRMLNMADELGLQYRSGMALLASIQDDKDVPANQRAQVFNSVGAMLEKIVKQQKVVYDAERLKRYEAAWMKTMKSLPEEQQKLFFNLYGDYLTKPETPAPEAA
jgi:uncharacterized protein (UPF0147 family)